MSFPAVVKINDVQVGICPVIKVDGKVYKVSR